MFVNTHVHACLIITIYDFNVYIKTIIYLYTYVRIYPPGCMDAAVKNAWHSERNSYIAITCCIFTYVATYIFLALIPYTDLYK